MTEALKEATLAMQGTCLKCTDAKPCRSCLICEGLIAANAEISTLWEENRRLRDVFRRTYEYFQGPRACGDFTCMCGSCGLCSFRKENEVILAALSPSGEAPTRGRPSICICEGDHEPDCPRYSPVRGEAPKCARCGGTGEIMHERAFLSDQADVGMPCPDCKAEAPKGELSR